MLEVEEVPKQLVARFRAVSLERIDRIESTWLGLIEQTSTAEAEAELYQDLHTLKGDARVVGFADVSLLAERLEELVFAARRRRYRIHEDVDVVVTMAFQFLKMLLRKKVGQSQGGIDLGGFLKHIDEVLAEWPRTTQPPTTGAFRPSSRAVESVRIPQAVRQRLGAVTAQVFVEALASKPGSISRTRLVGVWQELARQLSELDAVSLAPLLRGHALSVRELAQELGKEVDVIVDAEEARVGLEVLDALNAALVHSLRNALDHGLEPPDARLAAGKPRRGTLRIRVTVAQEAIELVVADDGRGVDMEGVKRRAVTSGLMTAAQTAEASETELLELLFKPGFSLRENVSSISGRGVGMDAVQAAVQAVKGRVTMTSVPGRGATLSILVPQASCTMEVACLPSTAGGISLVVSSAWVPRVVPSVPTHLAAVDPLPWLGITPTVTTPTFVVLHRDRDEHCLAVSGPPTLARATRICPTSPSEPFEVVQVGDEPVLMIRPELLLPLVLMARV